MIYKVQKYIIENNLVDKDSKIIVGLSGGPDSMVLIYILLKLNYDCIAAHCNFHLRGESSNADAAFVKEWCKTQKVPLHSIDFDTKAYAYEKKISIEMAARELRYKWFEELRVELEASVVAVAHHIDDSIETFLINLIRGTGIKGLTGIPHKNGKVIRPLLTVSRNEIMKLLSEENINYVTDHTNLEDNYLRNNIRLNLLPLMEKINPSVRKSIEATYLNLQEVEKVYDTYINETLSLVLRDNVINIEELKQTNSPQSVLFEILSPLGFTSSTIIDIANNLNSIPGKIYFSQSHRLLKDRKELILSPIIENKNQEEIYEIHPRMKTSVPFNFETSIESHLPGYKINKDNSVLEVDLSKLSFPLQLRKWNKGDWFIPLGMKGKKKISDFLTDIKLNLFEKEELWVLTSKDKIVWVVNYRIDDRFKITENTVDIFKICINKDVELFV